MNKLRKNQLDISSYWTIGAYLGDARKAWYVSSTRRDMFTKNVFVKQLNESFDK